MLKGYDKLTDQLQEELATGRREIEGLRTELATERLESARLRLLVQRLGGVP